MKRVVLFVCVLLALASTAHASSLTYDLKTEITFVHDGLSVLPGLSSGDTIDLFVTLDSGTPNTSGNPAVGTYLTSDPSSFFGFQNGATTWGTDGFAVTVANDSGPSFFKTDAFDADAFNFPTNGLNGSLTLTLVSTDPAFTSSTNLPGSVDPSLANLVNLVTFQVNPIGSLRRTSGFTGVVESATVTDPAPVPEPTTLALLGGGLITIASRLRKSARRDTRNA